MVRWSWVNFQCRGVLFVWIRVGQGPTALAVGAAGGCLDIFTLIYPFSSLSPSLWETTRYRLKYCLKGSLSPKTTNQPKPSCTVDNHLAKARGLSPHTGRQTTVLRPTTSTLRIAFISNISQLRKEVESFGSEVEHWTFNPAAGVQIPPKSWDFFSLICYALFFVTAFMS